MELSIPTSKMTITFYRLQGKEYDRTKKKYADLYTKYSKKPDDGTLKKLQALWDKMYENITITIPLSEQNVMAHIMSHKDKEYAFEQITEKFHKIIDIDGNLHDLNFDDVYGFTFQEDLGR